MHTHTHIHCIHTRTASVHTYTACIQTLTHALQDTHTLHAYTHTRCKRTHTYIHCKHTHTRTHTLHAYTHTRKRTHAGGGFRELYFTPTFSKWKVHTHDETNVLTRCTLLCHEYACQRALVALCLGLTTYLCVDVSCAQTILRSV